MKFLISFLAGLALCFLSLIIIERLSRPQGLSDEQIQAVLRANQYQEVTYTLPPRERTICSAPPPGPPPPMSFYQGLLQLRLKSHTLSLNKPQMSHAISYLESMTLQGNR